MGTMTTTTRTSGPTERQVAFARELADEIARLRPESAGNTYVLIDYVRNAATVGVASRRIDALIANRDQARVYARVAARGSQARQPRSANPQINRHGIPDGFYAIDGSHFPFNRQPIRFFAVVTRRDGCVRVREVIGGHLDRYHATGTAQNVLDYINEDGFVNAAARYAHEIGRCYVCNTRLTDATSRSLGIGPDCRGGSTDRGRRFVAAQQAARHAAEEHQSGDQVTAAIRNTLAEEYRQVRSRREAATEEAARTHVPCNCEECGEVAIGIFLVGSTSAVRRLCDECAIDLDAQEERRFPLQHRQPVSVA